MFDDKELWRLAAAAEPRGGRLAAAVVGGAGTGPPSVSCHRNCGTAADSKGRLLRGCLPLIRRFLMVVVPAARRWQASLRPFVASVANWPQVLHQMVVSESQSV